MDVLTFTAVMSAALMHAGWNSLIKASENKNSATLAVSLGHLLPALIFIFYLPLPSASEIPLLLCGAGLRLGYQYYLARSYQAADMSVIYPIARGSVPLNIAVLTPFLFQEVLSAHQYMALSCILFGLLCVAWPRRGTRLVFRHLLPAFLSGLFITAYSLSDAFGARLAENPIGFYAWLSMLNVVFLIISTIVFRDKNQLSAALKLWPLAVTGGLMSFGAYALVIWSYTRAPIALVSALRESSIIFAVLISAAFLKERPTIFQYAGAGLIALGAMGHRFLLK